MHQTGRISLEHGAFSVPSALRAVPLDALDVSPAVLNLLEKRGFTAIGDFDSISYIEFRRYLRGIPSPTDVLLTVDRAIHDLVARQKMTEAASHPAGDGNTRDEKHERNSSTTEPNDAGDVEHSTPIYIPLEQRGQSLALYDLSVRLRNVCIQAGIRVLGQLHGKTFIEFGKLQNCGKKTVTELEKLVRRLQITANCSQILPGPAADPNIISVDDSVRSLALNELPVSKRLDNVMADRRWKKLGDVNGVSTIELLKTQNCGRKTIRELQELVRRANNGEFSPTVGGDIAAAIREVTMGIDRGLLALPSRDREIFEARLAGNNGNPRTLEDVGAEFRITRERVRQIVKTSMTKVRRVGGPSLARSLEVTARECERLICPLTIELFSMWAAHSDFKRPIAFYVRVLDDLDQFVPAWPSGTTREGADDPLLFEIDQAIETTARNSTTPPTPAEVFVVLRRSKVFSSLSISRFLAILRRSRRIVVELPRPDEPRLRLLRTRMRIAEFARPILEESTTPLTPEKIVERASARFGQSAVVASARGAINTLTPSRGFYALAPRAVGLRKHFTIPSSQWPILRKRFAEILSAENRPVSTIEAIDRRLIPEYHSNSYELAQIVREDHHFIDLGRHLFALATWGIQERDRVKDLVPRVFAEAGCVLTAANTLKRLTRFRSVSPYSIGNLLQKHSSIKSFGFGYYGLVNWGVEQMQPMLRDVTVVEHAVRRATPPMRFDALCAAVGITSETAEASLLWKTCLRSRKLRYAPEQQAPETLLLHKVVSVEMVLASVARALARPAPSYEFEWELRARLGALFPRIGLAEIEERLARSDRFIRTAAGDYTLDEQIDFGSFDVEELTSAVVDSLRDSRDVASTEEIIERLEQSGVDMTDLSADIVSAALRGSIQLQEVAHQRFRAK